MEMVDPLIDDNVVLYLVGIDWVVSKGDKGRSKSRSGGMFGASMLFCRLWDCIKVEKGEKLCICAFPCR